jgi:hypothetical protein
MPEIEIGVDASDEGPFYPDATVSDQWVAVQFHEYGPVLVLHDDGTVTERMTMPAVNNIAQLPLGGAA